MADFLDKLLSWYGANARDFPFRDTTDPYLIWLSEIIMQQTRIEQGVPYYNKFADVFPTIHDLAGASEEEVLKQWQGLGYYSRARHLHATANEVVEKYNGKFPGTYEELRALKGIGDYTAAAIASVCFGLPHPVVDGNVTRFITRHFGITGAVDKAETKKEILEVLTGLMESRLWDGSSATELLRPTNGSLPKPGKPFASSLLRLASPESSPSGDPAAIPDATEPSLNLLTSGTFNQAMIEFGATYCTPRNPDCSECIFSESCYALKYGIVEKLPLKKQQQALKPRYFHYLVISVRGRNGWYFRKRSGNDIWKGLYEFPLIETSKPVTLPRLMSSADWKKLFGKTEFVVKGQGNATTHLLSHQKIIAKFYSLEINSPSDKFGILIHPKKMHELPVPRIMERYLNRET